MSLGSRQGRLISLGRSPDLAGRIADLAGITPGSLAPLTATVEPSSRERLRERERCIQIQIDRSFAVRNLALYTLREDNSAT